MTTIDHDVPDSWQRIGGWLAAHTRQGPVRAAADAARLDALEAELGLPLPADLRAWWLLPGVTRGDWIPQAFAPVPLEESLDTRGVWLLVAEQEQEWREQQEREGDGSGGAGRVEDRFLPEFLPIASDPGGDGLFVDLRPGGTHGAVFRWDHESWVLDVPQWGSVAAMLRDVAHALEAGAPVLLGHAALGGAEEPRTAAVDGEGALAWRSAAAEG
ncbi:SMI1/KNR4 family protein [Kitasatospora sp. NPDC088391]|uniref:SMI1/KNR4 family protein n=1 Tax=Kitasatospora sp. NPDC088391 TaxID=3364074 RepID=UPI0038178817